MVAGKATRWTRGVAPLSVMALTVFSLFFSGGPVAAAPLPAAAASHCAALIAPRTPADVAARRPSPVLKRGCFATLQERDAALEEWGRAAGVVPNDLADLFGIWDNSNFGGNSYIWASPSGCGASYQVDDLAAYGWDNRARSAAAYCGRTAWLYRDTYEQGPSLPISGGQGDLGSLDDQASSWNM